MSSRATLIRFQFNDVIRSRWLLMFGFSFWLISDLLLRFNSGVNVLISMNTILLILIPLLSMIQAAIFVYSSREYIELMLTQPVSRADLFISLWLGYTIPFIIMIWVSVALPYIYFYKAWILLDDVIIILLLHTILILIFTGIAFWVAFKVDERTKGLGILLGLWLFISFLFDTAIMIFIQLLGDYPIEHLVLIFSFLNPVDLARILSLIQLQISAMMGYTGALFQIWLDGITGIIIGISSLLLWIGLPLLSSFRRFKTKDF